MRLRTKRRIKKTLDNVFMIAVVIGFIWLVIKVIEHERRLGPKPPVWQQELDDVR